MEFTEILNFLSERISIILGIFILSSLIILLFFFPSHKKKVKKKLFIYCPLRKKCFRKYDAQGKFNEEYQRIILINYFLKKGYSASSLRLEYPLEKYFGHKGRSKVKILVDLLIIKDKRCFLVAEVKKGYLAEWKKSAIEHQLKPAMEWTKSKYGIYWDGTEKSCYLIRESNGNLRVKDFNLARK